MQICFCPVATHVLAVWPVMGLQVMLPIVYKCNADLSQLTHWAVGLMSLYAECVICVAAAQV